MARGGTIPADISGYVTATEHFVCPVLIRCKRRGRSGGHHVVAAFRLRELFGRGKRIRTSGPCVPNTVLYQAELFPDQIPTSWSRRQAAAYISEIERSKGLITGISARSVGVATGRTHPYCTIGSRACHRPLRRCRAIQSLSAPKAKQDVCLAGAARGRSRWSGGSDLLPWRRVYCSRGAAAAGLSGSPP